MAIETVHVRETHIPGLTAGDLEEKSFYEILRDRYGIVIVGGTQTIEPTVTDEDESAALGVPLHSPAFRFERVTHSDTGEIVEFVESIYRGDRYRLVTALSVPQERRRRKAPSRVAQFDGHGSARVVCAWLVPHLAQAIRLSQANFCLPRGCCTLRRRSKRA